MTRVFWTVILSLASACAQSVVVARAGAIYAIEGAVTIDGRPIDKPTQPALPQVNPGQVLISSRGHAEMLMGQDVVLWTGNDTQVRLDDANLDAPRLSLIAGAVILELKHTRPDRRIFIDLSGQSTELTAAGVYRLDRNPDRIRVWSGSVSPPSNQPFDRHDKDDLHYFAAYRSLALETEAGKFEHWKNKDGGKSPWKYAKILVGNFRHAGFDLDMPLPVSAARAKYIAASEAGLVNDVNGAYRLGPASIESHDQHIELFLGLGITARLNRNSRLRILDTKGIAPVAALEAGEVMIEVAKSAENTHLELHIGDSIVEFHKPGLYRFDLNSSAPSHAVAIPDHKHPDEFFTWNRKRSAAMFESDASFMSDWQPLLAAGMARHKQYGDMRITPSIPIRLPGQLPSTLRRPNDPKPPIVDQPIDKTPDGR